MQWGDVLRCACEIGSRGLSRWMILFYSRHMRCARCAPRSSRLDRCAVLCTTKAPQTTMVEAQRRTRIKRSIALLALLSACPAFGAPTKDPTGSAFVDSSLRLAEANWTAEVAKGSWWVCRDLCVRGRTHPTVLLALGQVHRVCSALFVIVQGVRTNMARADEQQGYPTDTLSRRPIFLSTGRL